MAKEKYENITEDCPNTSGILIPLGVQASYTDCMVMCADFSVKLNNKKHEFIQVISRLLPAMPMLKSEQNTTFPIVDGDDFIPAEFFQHVQQVKRLDELKDKRKDIRDGEALFLGQSLSDYFKDNTVHRVDFIENENITYSDSIEKERLKILGELKAIQRVHNGNYSKNTPFDQPEQSTQGIDATASSLVDSQHEPVAPLVDGHADSDPISIKQGAVHEENNNQSPDLSSMLTIPTDRINAGPAYAALKQTNKADDTAAKKAIGKFGRIERAIARGFFRVVGRDDFASQVEARFYNKGINKIKKREGR